MKAASPKKTRSGCAHHASGRIVWPNVRAGIVTSAWAIGKNALESSLNSDAPSAFQENPGLPAIAGLFVNRFEAGEHGLRFGNFLQRDAIADRKELVPHREDTRVLVRFLDCFM